eukprot:GHVS01060424.1.p1 GENE.GHVS01060424.1~~GHVS01060424.1.p1  ORF type:complete len:104 (+),score=18.36 GHVS01060424.1:116-427(+)
MYPLPVRLLFCCYLFLVLFITSTTAASNNNNEFSCLSVHRKCMDYTDVYKGISICGNEKETITDYEEKEGREFVISEYKFKLQGSKDDRLGKLRTLFINSRFV